MNRKVTGYERYKRGLAKLNQVNKEAGERLIQNFKTVAPDLARYVVEFPFGDILSRPGLDLKSREMITVAALTALGNAEPQLKDHMHSAMNVGLTREEIVEIVLQMAVYAGFPAAIRAMNVAKTVFQERKAKRPKLKLRS
jgi:4-carboxymuconolactone decarboxylase